MREMRNREPKDENREERAEERNQMSEKRSGFRYTFPTWFFHSMVSRYTFNNIILAINMVM